MANRRDLLLASVAGAGALFASRAWAAEVSTGPSVTERQLPPTPQLTFTPVAVTLYRSDLDPAGAAYTAWFAFGATFGRRGGGRWMPLALYFAVGDVLVGSTSRPAR